MIYSLNFTCVKFNLPGKKKVINEYYESEVLEAEW